MSESTGEAAREGRVTAETFMVVDRITQKLITQQLRAALEHLDVIATALREDGGRANLGLLYASTINARAHVDGALKELPWAPLSPEDRGRRVLPPPPA